MTTEKVFSTILDESKNPNGKFWKECYHEYEIEPSELKTKTWYVYHVKFDGLKPMQVTKIEKL